MAVSNGPDRRPPILPPVALQLRQEAGFGCCVCGLPIYQYHHIIPWRDEPHYRSSDMMILCPNHHDRVTKGAMSERRQRRYKNEPHNIKRGCAGGKLEIDREDCALVYGGNLFRGNGRILIIDKRSIISIRIGEHHNLEVTLCLEDDMGSIIAYIWNNEWISGDPMPWDIKSDYRTLTIRRGVRDIRLSLDAKRTPAVLRGQFWRSGHLIKISEKNVKIIRGGNTKPAAVFLQNRGLTMEIDSVSGAVRACGDLPESTVWHLQNGMHIYKPSIYDEGLPGTCPRCGVRIFVADQMV
jgi:hypothetical protein